MKKNKIRLDFEDCSLNNIELDKNIELSPMAFDLGITIHPSQSFLDLNPGIEEEYNIAPYSLDELLDRGKSLNEINKLLNKRNIIKEER